MTSTLNKYVHPYTIIYLERIPGDLSVYRVIKKEDLDIPALFGKIPSGSYFAGEECLVFEFDYNETEERLEGSLFTTILGGSPLRIARFTLSPDNMACISYDDYRTILEFADNLRMLSLWVYKEEKEPESEINPEWGRNFKGPLYEHRAFLS